MKYSFVRFLIIIIIYVLYLSPLSAYSSPIDHMQNNHLIGNNFLTDQHENIYLIQNGGLYFKSNKINEAWGLKVPNIQSASIDPINSETIYIITLDNKLKKTTDNGKTWQEIRDGLPSMEIFGSPQDRLFINPHNNSEVYFATSSGLYKSINGGLKWNLTSFKENVWQFLINPKDPKIFYALSASGLYLSTDSGKDWKKIDNSIPKKHIKVKGRSAERIKLMIGSVAVINYTQPFLLAFTVEDNNFKIYKTVNNGSTWVEVGSDLQNEEPTSVYIGGAEVIIGTAKGRLYKSNTAINWQEIELPNVMDLKIGSALLSGELRFERGGPACMSCHSISALKKSFSDKKPLFNENWLNADFIPEMGLIYSKKNVTNREVQYIRAFLSGNSYRESVFSIYPDTEKGGYFLLTSNNQLVKVYEKKKLQNENGYVKSSQPDNGIENEAIYNIYSDNIDSWAASLDEKYFAVRSSKRITLFDSSNWQKIRDFEGTRFDFSKDGKYLVVDSIIYETADWQEVKKIEFKSGITAVSFSPDSRFLVLGENLGYNGNLHIYDIENSFNEIMAIPHKKGWISKIEFSPDGRFLATWENGNGYAERTYVFNVDTWGKVGEIQNCFDFEFSSDSQYLVTSGGEKCNSQVFEIQNWKYLGAAQNQNTSAASFSPDNTKVAISFDKTISIFNISDMSKSIELVENEEILDVFFILDGAYLAAIGKRDAAGRTHYITSIYDTDSWKKQTLKGFFAFNEFSGKWLLGLRQENNNANVVALDLTRTRMHSLYKKLRILGFEQVENLVSKSKKIELEAQNKDRASKQERAAALSRLDNTKKDEFETEVEYKARLSQRGANYKDLIALFEERQLALRRESADKRILLLHEYEPELEKLQSATRKPVNLQISLGEYNADTEIFPIAVEENGVAFFRTYIKIQRTAAKNFKENFKKFNILGEIVRDGFGFTKLEKIVIQNLETAEAYYVPTPVVSRSTYYLSEQSFMYGEAQDSGSNPETPNNRILLGETLIEYGDWQANIKILCFNENQECGSVEFQSLNCGGSLIYVGSENNGFVFREDLTFGSCVQGCNIWINRTGAIYREFCQGRETGGGALH